MNRRHECRGCGFAQLVRVHDFGHQPLAGYFPVQPESSVPAPRYPLELAACPRCALLQVTHLPPIEEIFHAEYRYSSSTVPGLRRHFDAFADELQARIPEGARLFEFGCNDGILLERLKARSFRVRGVDASANMVALAREKGLDVEEGFFSEAYVRARGLQSAFEVITCSNVYAHIDDLAGVTRGAWLALCDGGVFCIEVHDGATIAEQNQFDTVYHEHLTYFTAESIRTHLCLHGFEVDGIDRTAMHGGGLRVFARKQADASRTHSLAAVPQEWDAASLGVRISEAIQRARGDVLDLRRKHGKLWGYGAAGRAQMFLNFTGTANCFEAVFDDSRLRQGRFIAGTDVPVLPHDANPRQGCCVVLAWNYAADIAPRIKPRFDSVVTVLPAVQGW